MTYQAHTGDVADAPYRNQRANLTEGNYLLDGGGVSIADSTTSVTTAVEESVLRFGNETIVADQQTLIHPDGDPDDPRLDAITIDANGDAARTVGTPAPADPPNRIGQRVRTPTPPDLSDTDAVCVALVWVPAGLGSSAEMYNDWIIPRQMPGHGLNSLELLPGRDLQYRLDQAHEGETLRGDRSQVITLAQPLTLSTPGVTIRDLNLRYAAGAATNDTDDMLTVAASGCTIQNVTLDGNKQNQTAAPDGITITHEGDDASIEGILTEDIPGYAVNVNGGYGAGTVIDVDAKDIKSDFAGKGALVIQGDAARTSAGSIISRNSDTGGPVLIRNGPAETALADIFARGEDYGLKLADFGAGNDNSAPVEGTRVDGLSVDETPQAVTADTAAIGHRDLWLRDVRGRRWPSSTSESPIDVDNILGATVKDSVLKGFVGGVQAIRGAYASGLRVTDTVIAEPQGDGAVGVITRDATNVTVTSTTINGGGTTFSAGVLVLARDGGLPATKVLGNTIYNIGGGDGIKLDETPDGPSIKATIVKNNVTPSVTSDASGSGVVIKDNVSR